MGEVLAWHLDISIHALREEGDLPARPAESHDQRISIHALREEGDDQDHAEDVAGDGISIHALREEGDLPVGALSRAHSQFLSTPSARRATRNAVPSRVQRFYFYPRPPRGGRRQAPFFLYNKSNFYPRPPRGGRQQKQRQNLYFLINYTTFCTNLEEP